ELPENENKGLDKIICQAPCSHFQAVPSVVIFAPDKLFKRMTIFAGQSCTEQSGLFPKVLYAFCMHIGLVPKKAQRQSIWT
ncbi:MAG: hypothetical protein K2G80_05835, partial [Bacteroidales bacterium]|nr:hypothetical protein [Bacteroidales bacterium]